MSENQIELFLHNIEMAIKFHDVNPNDPHNVGNAVKIALVEVRDALGFAMKGRKQPEPKVAATVRTNRELHYEKALNAIVNFPQQENNTTEMRLRLIAKDALRSAK